MFKDWKVWALFPLVALFPFILAFFSTDITKSFISCMLGVEYIGYWFVVYGTVASLSAYLVGFIAKYTGRIPLIFTDFALAAGLHIFILLWDLKKEQYIILYSLAGLYGLFEAIFQTQVNCNTFIFNNFIKISLFRFFVSSNCWCGI